MAKTFWWCILLLLASGIKPAVAQTSILSAPFICQWANIQGGCAGKGWAQGVPNATSPADDNCGPTSVLMVASKWNGTTPNSNSISQEDAWLQNTFGSSWGYVANGGKGSGTEPPELASLASNYFDLADATPFSGWTLAQLKQELAQGYPVIVRVRPQMMANYPDAHYMVLLGMDDQLVYVNDPGIRPGALAQYPLQDFINSWAHTAAWDQNNNEGVSIHPAASVMPIGDWTWMSGSDVAAAPGSYGAQGSSSNTNVPGARDSAFEWSDGNSDLWLFGGEGYDASGTFGNLNDLWKFDPSSKSWTWILGKSTVPAARSGWSGVYGSRGIPSTINAPGSHLSGVSWMDRSGNFWLFGGFGNDSTGTMGNLNDLWEFNPSTELWTWIGGSSTVPADGGNPGIYGSKGTPSVTNVPGSRYGAVGWTDRGGNLWLFGGGGYDSKGTLGNLNDLWEFSSSNRAWTWVSGSNLAGSSGKYGTKGTPAGGNIPGSRNASISWTDPSGNFWLFGGNGFDSSGTFGRLNDLWEYDLKSNAWTWINGSSTQGAVGVYVTQGSPSTSSLPGGREGAVSWVDLSGNLWLFGGYGFDSTGNQGYLSDLWEFNSTTKMWTWMAGSKVGQSKGVYGEPGISSSTNLPGGRAQPTSWRDNGGNFWLFGGSGIDSTGNTTANSLNDLWRYQP